MLKYIFLFELHQLLFELNLLLLELNQLLFELNQLLFEFNHFLFELNRLFCFFMYILYDSGFDKTTTLFLLLGLAVGDFLIIDFQ